MNATDYSRDATDYSRDTLTAIEGKGHWSEIDRTFVDHQTAMARKSLGATMQTRISGHPSYGRRRGDGPNWPSHGHLRRDGA